MRLLLFLVLFPSIVFAQNNGFEFGDISLADMAMKEYPKDTTAEAVVLNEFGDSYVLNASFNIKFEYHIRIKILKPHGTRFANYQIPLRINSPEKESLDYIQASTFNLEGNSIKETKLEVRNIFIENTSKYWELRKFALPSVRVGSIIEIKYQLESPFVFNWRTWEFQSDIPKINTEFWAKIPANYNYNIALRGYQSLSKNQSELVHSCVTTSSGGSADCSLLKYGMINVPAFKEEQFMTAKENFLSAVYFELTEIKRFDGSVIRYTQEWRDAERKLQIEEKFGIQIKQARKIWDDRIQESTKDLQDPIAKAKMIFDQIKKYYLWNNNYGIFTELGAKRAFESKKGNIADINLALVGALQSAGLQVEPALLSTRKNGLPIMLHPVLSGFNYVIAHATIGADQYWLDATDRLHPFGFVPERCLNGKVRVMSKVSTWVDLKPKDKNKKVTEVSLSVNKDGSIGGTLKVVHFGYDAFDQRKEYFSYSSADEYWKSQAKKWTDFEVMKYSCKGADSLEGNFTEQFEILFNEKADRETLYISPFLIESWKRNPFKSNERTYPVDFGAPLEETTLLKLDYQNLFAVDELPRSLATALPKSGGRFTFNVSNLNNAIQMTCNLTLNKSVYDSEEYHFLKEFFAKVVQTQESQFVLKKIK